MEITSNRPKKIHNVKAHIGRIIIGDFFESIYVPLDLWSRKDYERQWKEGIERLKNYKTSCLVATIHDPLIRPYIDWWILYRVKNTVYVRNQMIMDFIYKKRIGNREFTTETCYDFIKPRKRQRKNSPVISEWSVPYIE